MLHHQHRCRSLSETAKTVRWTTLTVTAAVDLEVDEDSAYNVAGRDSYHRRSTAVYATYAIDPKTSGDQPRAILKNSDLIKISIEDSG